MTGGLKKDLKIMKRNGHMMEKRAQRTEASSRTGSHSKHTLAAELRCPVSTKFGTANELRDIFTPLCMSVLRDIELVSSSSMKLYLKPSHNFIRYRPTNDVVRSIYGVPVDSFSAPFGFYYVLTDKSGHLVIGMKGPVGAYGSLFAQDLLNTTDVIFGFAIPNVSKAIEALMLENRTAFDKLVLKGNPTETFKEGIRSLTMAVALLTADRVADYEDPGLLLEKLFERSLPRTLSLALPFGILAPLVNAARYIPNILDCGPGGELSLSQSFKTVAAVFKEAIVTRSTQHGNTDLALGVGCPLGRIAPGEKTAGIDYLCDAFMNVYRKIRQT